MPDIAWAVLQFFSKLVPKLARNFGFDVICRRFDTSSMVRFRSSFQPIPDSFDAAFSTTFTTLALYQRSLWWFEISAATVDLEGSTFIPYATSVLLEAPPFRFRDTPGRAALACGDIGRNAA
jgi:hypothetical protein